MINFHMYPAKIALVLKQISWIKSLPYGNKQWAKCLNLSPGLTVCVWALRVCSVQIHKYLEREA